MTDDQPLFDPGGIPGPQVGSADNGDRFDYLGYFIDCSRAFGKSRPPKQIVNRMGKEIRKLVEEGTRSEELRKGIQILVDRALPPQHLPECVYQAQQKPDLPVGPDRTAVEAERHMLRDFLEEHGGRWPTGARFVRGYGAGAAVWDPLGYDPRPHDFPHPKPNRAVVMEALIARASPGQPVPKPRD